MKPGTNDPVGTLGHSSGCPLLWFERLFVSSLPEGEEAGRAGAGFSTSVSSGSSSSCATLAAQPAESAFQPSLSSTSIGNPAISLSSRPRLADDPNSYRDSQGDLERLSREEGLRKIGRTFISTSSSVDDFDEFLAVQVRVFVEDINSRRCGDTYIGRGSRQLRLQPIAWRNPYKISLYGRDLAIDLDKENDKGKFQAISAHRLACHCRPEQACHGDAIISRVKLFSPGVLCEGAIGAAFRRGGKGGGGGTRATTTAKTWTPSVRLTRAGRALMSRCRSGEDRSVEGSPMGHLFSHQGVGLTHEEGSPQTRPGPECQLASGNRPRHWTLPNSFTSVHTRSSWSRLSMSTRWRNSEGASSRFWNKGDWYGRRVTDGTSRLEAF